MERGRNRRDRYFICSILFGSHHSYFYHPVYASPSASKSEKSFFLPVARLFDINSSKPMYLTGSPPYFPSTQSESASSHETPVIEVIRSILTGGTPSCTTLSKLSKSSTASPSEPKPKSSRAVRMRRAFSEVGLKKYLYPRYNAGRHERPVRSLPQSYIQLDVR